MSNNPDDTPAPGGGPTPPPGEPKTLGSPQTPGTPPPAAPGTPPPAAPEPPGAGSPPPGGYAPPPPGPQDLPPGYQAPPGYPPPGAGYGAPGGTPPYGTPPYGAPGYGTPGHGYPAASSDDRTWVLLAHFGGAVLGFLAPLIVLIARPGSPLVRAHAVEALNFQLTWFVVVLVLSVVTCGIGAIAFVFPVIMAIIAGVKAANGEPYRYPLTVRVVK